MRKYFCVILLLVAISGLVSCGNNTQKANSIGTLEIGNTLFLGGYEWRVLSIYDNNTALVISERIINNLPFHFTFSPDVTWENSDIRWYLNEDFLEIFSCDERDIILPKSVSTPDNAWYGVRGGADSNDYVFLPSIEEIVRYFGDSDQWYHPDMPENGVRQWLLSDEFDNARIAVDLCGNPTPWWLRSPGFDLDFTAIVRDDGSIRVDGESNNNIAGVRPLLLLKLD